MYAEELAKAQHARLAENILLTNQRALEYLRWNLPTSTKQDKAQSLRAIPEKHGLDANEWKFLRIDNAIKNPLSLLDKLEDGTVTQDEVKAVKYVYPELHAEIVQGVTQGIFEMKQRGDSLPVEKVAQLGLVLDAPVDPILEQDFIRPVQRALALPPGGEGATAQQQSAPPQINRDLLTPIDQGLLG